MKSGDIPDGAASRINQFPAITEANLGFQSPIVANNTLLVQVKKVPKTPPPALVKVQ